MVDALSTISTILSDNWDSDNTDSITPTIQPISTMKKADYLNNDYVLLYYINEGNGPFGCGGNSWKDKPSIAIDIRTTYLKKNDLEAIRAHMIKIKDEVKSIIQSKINKPDATYQLLVPRQGRDMSDRRSGMARWVMDVDLTHWYQG